MLLKEKAGFMSLVIICAVFSIYLINPVSAEDTSDSLGCCERTNSGESCRYTTTGDCDADYAVGSYVRCEDSSFCKLGCCVSPDGSCSKQVSKATCENEGSGYAWNSDAECSIKKCQKGCCVIGGAECRFATEKKCAEITAGFEGLSVDFKDSIETEKECTNVCKEKDDGCCVKETGECTRTTRAMCGMQDGTGSKGFYENTFCSNEKLQNACSPRCREKAKTSCADGLEDVYWFDSCGNMEDTVSEIINGSESPKGDGNCDYAEGTICSNADNSHQSAYCKNVNCERTLTYSHIAYSNKSRANGESWCIYDSKPGPLLDTAGSRHWRHMCINGEEIVEPCKDFREEYCTQSDTQISGDIYREAGCRDSKSKECTTLCNTAKDARTQTELRIKTKLDERCCGSTSRKCVWNWLDEENETGTCLPMIPAGLTFWELEEEKENKDKEICESRNTEIKTIWEKNDTYDINATWEERNRLVCKRNCEAYGNESLLLNQILCIGTGDCGAKYNFIGVWNDEGFFREWDGEPSGSPKPKLNETEIPEELMFNLSKDIGQGIYDGFVGYNNTEMVESINLMISGETSIWAAILGFGGMAILGASMSTILVGLIILLIMLLFKPKREERMVNTACELWQAPSGGMNCSACDNQTLHPCSEYRCRSLGKQCKFIYENEGTKKATCYQEAPNDVTRPIISPWYNDDGNFPIGLRKIANGEIFDIHEEYEIEVMPENSEIAGGYAIRKKLPGFSTIEFGIRTENKPSQCKYSTVFDKESTFAKSPNWFSDSYYSKSHNRTIHGLLPNKKYEFYVICRGANGYPKDGEITPPYKIEFETDEGPDLTPPYIVSSEPANGGYINSGGNATLVLYVDEVSPFQCKYSKKDIGFEQMEKNMTCIPMPKESRSQAYGICAGEQMLAEEKNDIYFRCSDYPENSNETNVMDESYKITLLRSKPLGLRILSPVSGRSYHHDYAELKAVTYGGSGSASCTYFETGQGLFAGEFTSKDGKAHESSILGLENGFYNLDIECFDSIENSAKETLNFTLSADKSPPSIIAMYRNEQGIYIGLDEESNCVYSSESFAHTRGELISNHSTNAQLPSGISEYHLICKDNKNNAMPEITVR